MMTESILICSTRYAGCGYVGKASTFINADDDFVLCPTCKDDHSFQLTEENFAGLTNDNNEDLARHLLDESSESLESE